MKQKIIMAILGYTSLIHGMKLDIHEYIQSEASVTSASSYARSVHKEYPEELLETEELLSSDEEKDGIRVVSQKPAAPIDHVPQEKAVTYVCSICSYTVWTMRNCGSHIRNNHNDNSAARIIVFAKDKREERTVKDLGKAYRCIPCDKLFRGDALYKSHLKSARHSQMLQKYGKSSSIMEVVNELRNHITPAPPELPYAWHDEK